MKDRKSFYVTPAMTAELIEANINAISKPEYIERAKLIERKIAEARRENAKYYKSLQAQEDKKWADIKAKRNKKRGK